MSQVATPATVAAAVPAGRFLTTQERQFVLHFAQGMTLRAAAKSAGMTPNAGYKLIERPDVAQTIVTLQRQATEELGELITRDFVGGMILEAHKKAATATEELTAARDLAKLYGLNSPEKQVHVTYNVTRVEQLESLPDAELARLAGLDSKLAAPPATRVEDDEPELTPEETADAGE